MTGSTRLVTGYRDGCTRDGLILPQFVPTNGLWLDAKLAFPHSPGASEADDVP